MVHFMFIAPMHSYVTNVFVYNLHISILVVCTRMLLVCYSYVTGMLLVYTRMSLVCTRVYSYVSRMLLACTREFSYVTRMYSYVTRMYSCVVLVTIYKKRYFSRIYPVRPDNSDCICFLTFLNSVSKFRQVRLFICYNLR